MYKHLVLWKMKESANGMTRKQLATEVKQRLETLPAIIPEIVDFEVGLNIGAYGASFFDVSLIATYPAAGYKAEGNGSGFAWDTDRNKAAGGQKWKENAPAGKAGKAAKGVSGNANDPKESHKSITPEHSERQKP